ncbi:MAG TPA: hypothetical protein DCM45_05730 [Clostridiales bacterium]|nr:hypothetical protein [Clostridiales bacterium]
MTWLSVSTISKILNLTGSRAYRQIGFGSPVWYEMPPKLRCFVESMPQQNGKPAFVFSPSQAPEAEAAVV